MNYNNGNGTIIEIINNQKGKWEYRKHFQQLKIDDYININQIAKAGINNQFYILLKVRTGKNNNGWLFLGKYSYGYAKFNDPYFNNR